MKIKKKAIFIFFCFNLTLFTYSRPVHSINNINSPKSSGMANAFTAISDDEITLFTNPAGLGLKKKHLKQNSNQYDNLFDPRNLLYIELINFPISEHNVSFSETIKNPFVFSTLNFSYFNKPNNTFAWGISILNQSYGNYYDISKLGSHLDLTVETQLAIGFNPFSFSIISPYDFHLAFNTRFFYLYDLEKIYIGNINNFQAFTNTLMSLFQNEFINNSNLINTNFFEGTGIAMDIGILWEMLFPDKENQINLGVSIFDTPGILFPLLTRTSQQNSHFFFQPNINFGLAYKMPYKINNFFNNSSIAIDYIRILDTNLDHLSKLRVGITTDVFNYKSKIVFNVSLGMKLLKPSFSFTILIYQFRINYTLNPVQLKNKYKGSIKFANQLSFSVYL